MQGSCQSYCGSIALRMQHRSSKEDLEVHLYLKERQEWYSLHELFKLCQDQLQLLNPFKHHDLFHKCATL